MTKPRIRPGESIRSKYSHSKAIIVSQNSDGYLIVKTTNGWHRLAEESITEAYYLDSKPKSEDNWIKDMPTFDLDSVQVLVVHWELKSEWYTVVFKDGKFITKDNVELHIGETPFAFTPIKTKGSENE